MWDEFVDTIRLASRTTVSSAHLYKCTESSNDAENIYVYL